MAGYVPAGIIRIGNVPWDNTYAHVRWYETSADQYNEISSHMDSQLSENDYTYVRKDGAIRVPYNAENLYTKNYVMYQNANYGNKWFYCFITQINYLNENTTELILETDIFQTYMFDIVLKPGFIEREHVANDAIGQHRNPEPEMPLEYIYTRRWSDNGLNDTDHMWVVVQSNAVPNYKDQWGFDDTVPHGSNAVVGGWYSNVFSGSKYYAFTKADGGHGSDYGIFNWLEAMNKAGAAESISNIFMFPQAFIPPSQRGKDYGLPEDQGGYGYEHNWDRPTSLDGYRPHNNKLFTYPYCFCRFDNNNGQHLDVKFEDWDSPYQWSVQTTLDPDATVFVIPQNYQGVENNVPEAMTFQMCPKCSWNYSSYQTWSAQNSLANYLSIGLDIAMMAYPAARGAGAAVKAVTSSFRAAKSVKAAGYGIKNFGKGTAKGAANAAENAVKDTNPLLPGIGALGLVNTASEISKQSKVPDTVRGIAAGNTLFGLHYMTYNVSDVVVRYEYARIVDSFFDMYGYAIEQVLHPLITSRKSWNFIKMHDAQHKGNIPAPELAVINNAFNNGVTFWHTWDISNYDLDNSIRPV